MRILIVLSLVIAVLALVPLAQAAYNEIPYTLAEYIRNDTGLSYQGGVIIIGNATGYGINMTGLFKFNITDYYINGSINVTRATLLLVKDSIVGGGLAPVPNFTVWGSQNQSWTYPGSDYASYNAKIATAANNLTLINYNKTYPLVTTDNYYFDVTEWVKAKKQAGHSNVSIILNESNSGGAYYITYAASPIILNVTYEQWYVLASNYEPIVLETKNAIYNISFYDVYGGGVPSSVSLTLNGTNVGYTHYIHSGNYYNYSYVGVPGLLQNNINISNITVEWNYTVLGNKYNLTKQQELNRLRIEPCAAPMLNETAKFSFYDEDDLVTRVKTNIGATFFLWVNSSYRNYSYSNLSYADYDFCMYPGWAQFNMNTTIVYSNASYSTRTYWAANLYYTNSTTTKLLYLLASTNSTNIFFTVYDQNKIPQPNIIIRVLRYYPSTNTYTEVASGKTGYSGTESIPLELYQYYQYVMEINGIAIVTTPTEKLATTVKDLYISPLNYVSLFDYITGVYAGCTIDNTTKILTCTMNDQSGKLSYANLKVTRLSTANLSVTVCDLTSAVKTFSLACNLTNYNTSDLTYYFTGYFSDTGSTRYTFASGTISWSSSLMNLGLMGVFLAFLITVTLFFAGMTNSPTTAILLGSIGVLISSFSGIITIGWGSLFPLILVGVIIIYKMED